MNEESSDSKYERYPTPLLITLLIAKYPWVYCLCAIGTLLAVQSAFSVVASHLETTASAWAAWLLLQILYAVSMTLIIAWFVTTFRYCVRRAHQIVLQTTASRHQKT